MFAIEVSTVFSAAHALRLGGGAIEPLHGHDFRVMVRVVSAALDGVETVMDFHAVERLLEEIVGPWRNRNLNELEPFSARVNPSAERIAETIGAALREKIQTSNGARVALVRVSEARGCFATWEA